MGLKGVLNRRKALRPIPRIVDNTDAMGIAQSNIDNASHPVVRKDSPGGKGTFAPKSNINFK